MGGGKKHTSRNNFFRVTSLVFYGPSKTLIASSWYVVATAAVSHGQHGCFAIPVSFTKHSSGRKHGERWLRRVLGEKGPRSSWYNRKSMGYVP